MAVKARRSVLQTEILAELKTGPAHSITALASAIGSSRPSVSRSLHVLQEQGLVEQEGRVWSLSKVGESQVGISVAKLQEAIENSVGQTGRRFKVLDRMGMADVALVSLNEMVASQSSRFIRDAAAEELAVLGTAVNGSTTAAAALAMQEQTFARHALASNIHDMAATSGIKDHVKLHSALGSDLASGTAVTGLGHESMLSNALGSDLSTVSGARDFAAELGVTSASLAGVEPCPLQDIGGSAAASVWKSIESADAASRSVLADLGDAAAIVNPGTAETHWLLELDANAGSKADVLGSSSDKSTLGLSDRVHDRANDSYGVALVFDDYFGRGVPAILDPSTANAFRGATSIIAAQDQFASFLTSIPPGETTLGYAAIAEQTGLFASTVDNMVALQRIDFSALDMPYGRAAALSTLPERLTAVTDSFYDLFQDQVRHAQLSDLEPPDLMAEQMILATLPVAHFAEAVRSWVQPSDSSSRVARERPFREDRDDKRLDAMLAALNPGFVEMRHGAWHALETKGPDYVRHAGISYRELVRLVLRHFVPSSELEPEHRTGPGIKRRLSMLFGGDEKKARYAWALTEATFGAFDECNDYSHCLPIDEPSLRYFLLSAEGLLGFIIINAARAKG